MKANVVLSFIPLSLPTFVLSACPNGYFTCGRKIVVIWLRVDLQRTVFRITQFVATEALGPGVRRTISDRLTIVAEPGTALSKAIHAAMEILESPVLVPLPTLIAWAPQNVLVDLHSRSAFVLEIYSAEKKTLIFKNSSFWIFHSSIFG